jgi:uncharacterized protein (DUF58 family)
MDPKEIIKHIRQIEIKTKGLSKSIFSGEYHSAFKGIGMSFSEVRPYKYGDEVRYIDWNVTARNDEPHIKQFEEERELNVILLIDISRSTFFGTKGKLKNDLATEIAALISFSAISNNDKVGAILFTDRIEMYIPPKKGKKHILRIIREIIYFTPEGKKTDISNGLRYLNNVLLKRSIVFLISDFISPDFSVPLQIARKKHDLIALRIYDDMELQLPEVNILRIKDPETETEYLTDASSADVRQKYVDASKRHIEKLKTLCKLYKIDMVEIALNDDYTLRLRSFFKKRAK